MKTEFYTLEEFGKIYKELGIREKDYEACLNVKSAFRTGVDVSEDYTITQLRVIAESVFAKKADYMTLIFKKDAFYLVELKGENGLPRELYDGTLARLTSKRGGVEKVVAAFFDALTSGDDAITEEAYYAIGELEDVIVNGHPNPDFNKQLLEYKKYMLIARNYYDQLQDILEALEENFNDIILDKNIRVISNTLRKVTRLKDDTNAMIDAIGQIQNAYATHLDNDMNSTMKVLTIITTIFMPLTLIVGWYGMNFTTMPELAWEYGYRYVILLSVVMVVGLVVIAKKKKWF